MIYRPARFTGVAVGAGVAAVAVLLAAVLLAFAIGWDISTAKFLAFVGVFALLAGAAPFGYLAYAPPPPFGRCSTGPIPSSQLYPETKLPPG